MLFLKSKRIQIFAKVLTRTLKMKQESSVSHNKDTKHKIN